MTDAAEAVAGGAEMRLQHRLHLGAQAEVGMADDAGADLRRSVDAAGAHRGDAVDELGLADGAHLLRPVGPVHGAGLQVHRGDDVVAAVQVFEQLGQQIAPARPLPQVVMRVDDRERRIKDLLLPPVQPLLADWQEDAGGGSRLGGGHEAILPMKGGMLVQIAVGRGN